ncbi:Isoprenylcysteine carboxyl methyltransferase [Penicillium chermesinum]|nr:Isoprenylcysteine carboxyl methyltransferase [Penicillium chermesinum]
MVSDATATGAQPTLPELGDPNISWPIERNTRQPQEWHPSFLNKRRSSSPSSASSAEFSTANAAIYPNGTKALSGISLRAFLLGTTFGLSSTAVLLTTTLFPTPLWRAPFFIAALSLFHFLEFYVTARYNTQAATVSAFLLSSNGWAYNVAHGSALLECLVTQYFWPGDTRFGRWMSVTEPISGSAVSVLLLLGVVLTAVGQIVRTLAMAQAASNFNHHVQSERKEGHVLVTQGVYSVLRHPSYFGFFWWGLGTQLVLGMWFVSWGEEAFLVRFFGADYVQYRQATPVGIPGIR